LNARGLDLWDCVPAAVILDTRPGCSISARVTLFAQAGVGFYGDHAEGAEGYGMALGRWGPRWREEVGHLILLTEEEHELIGRNWPGGPDSRFLHLEGGKSVRRSGNVLIVIPLASGGEIATFPLRFRMARFPDWYSIPDSEVALFLGWFGLRVGLAPAQFVDFLCGFFHLDPLDDDGVLDREQGQATTEPQRIPEPEE
jgi:hypothetical protein